MDEKQKHVDNDYTLERVPSTARKSFLSMFVVMLGFTFFSASMSVGARIGNGMDFNGFVLAIIIGGCILGAYTGILGYIGCDTGFSLDLLSKHSFGTVGSKLPSALIAFTQIGWFGVGVAMFAIPAAELLGINPYIFIVVGGILMTGSAYFGMRALTIVSSISVPLIAVLGIYSMVLAVNEGGGIMEIFSSGEQSMSLLTAIALVIGSFISGGTATPNFVRFAKNNKTAVITTVIAFFLGNTLMFAFGAVGGAFTGSEDIFYVMIAQGLTIPALLVLGANIWTTNDNALYTGGLGLSNITGLRKRPMVLISGAIGTVTAMWLYYNFVSWLSFLNSTLPPIGAIIICDYFMNKAKYKSDDTTFPPVRIGAILGVIVGALVGNFVPFGITSINSMVAAVICFVIVSKFEKK